MATTPYPLYLLTDSAETSGLLNGSWREGMSAVRHAVLPFSADGAGGFLTVDAHVLLREPVSPTVRFFTDLDWFIQAYTDRFRS